MSLNTQLVFIGLYRTVPAFALAFQISILGHSGNNEFLTFDFSLNLFKACIFYLYFAFSYLGTNLLFVYILHEVNNSKIEICSFLMVSVNIAEIVFY